MKAKALVTLYFVLTGYLSSAQSVDYQPSTTKKWDLIHTGLRISPDWNKQQLDGQATLTLHPHFYPQKELLLDAKGFEIKGILNKGKNVAFDYDGKRIAVALEREFSRKDTLTLTVNYVAKPNELEIKGSDAISQDKGLYFVDPLAANRQFWTQGETQANSAWFPTLDTPNEKHTQDIYLRVEKALTTLSNGELVETINNNDGTKTDHWQMKKPHSVYLTMIAAGNFVQTVDPGFTGFEVSYYLEPEFSENASAIFGRTPAMISYFEQLLGVPYPWNKYSQIVVREYVSGAMENTTATVHGDFVLKNPNQLVNNDDDAVIAHELFHHWFGDLVTAESWSNLPLNESFADYSEYLWSAHRDGKEAGEWTALRGMQTYLDEAKTKQVPLIRYNYADREDMFDSHSYAKGGRILHMLRRYVGDEAFFASLNLYLMKNAYQAAEVHNLRMAFEEITGEDLNWFFNQWFLAPGHARLDVESYYKEGKLNIKIDQTIDSVNSLVYRLPLEVLIGMPDGKTTTKSVLVNAPDQIFSFELAEQPTFVLIDPRSELVGEINHPKGEGQLLAQYIDSPEMPGRFSALQALTFVPDADEQFAKNPLQDSKIREVIVKATTDSFWGIRDFAVQQLSDYDGDDFLQVERALQSVIKTDPHAFVRAGAIRAVKNFLNPQNDLLFRQALSDTSYAVRGAGLEALLTNKPPDAAELAAKFENIEDIDIFASVAGFYADEADPSRLNWFVDRLQKLGNTGLYQVMGIFATYLVKSDAATQRDAIPFLAKTAAGHSQYYVRYAAVQALLVLADVPEAQTALKTAVSNEKDERLKSVYEGYGL